MYYMYGIGRSEELIGETGKESGKRSELIVATEEAQKFTNGNMLTHNSPSFLVERSGKKLKASPNRLDPLPRQEYIEE